MITLNAFYKFLRFIDRNRESHKCSEQVEYLYSLHKEAWLKISKLKKHDENTKLTIVREICIREKIKDPIAGCFLCEVHFLKHCKNCKLIQCVGKESLYQLWVKAYEKEDFEKASEVALKIAHIVD